MLGLSWTRRPWRGCRNGPVRSDGGLDRAGGSEDGEEHSVSSLRPSWKTPTGLLLLVQDRNEDLPVLPPSHTATMEYSVRWGHSQQDWKDGGGLPTFQLDDPMTIASWVAGTVVTQGFPPCGLTWCPPQLCELLLLFPDRTPLGEVGQCRSDHGDNEGHVC